MNEENALSSGKEATEARVAERKLELSQLRTVIEEGRSMPLFEKVKEIFKNYGFTVSAIVLAAWIGAVIRAITTSLKPLGKGIGKALQDVSKKTASLCPASSARS